MLLKRKFMYCCDVKLFFNYEDVNECASNPCQNGATCHNGRDSYTCTCAGGWTGTNCDQGKMFHSDLFKTAVLQI